MGIPVKRKSGVVKKRSEPWRRFNVKWKKEFQWVEPGTDHGYHQDAKEEFNNMKLWILLYFILFIFVL